MAKTVHTCSGCVPIDSSILKVYAAMVGAISESQGLVIDDALSGVSKNPVENRVITNALTSKYSKPANGIPASDIADGVIPDVSGFVTKSVSDLANYYLKSETYTKSEVQEMIGAIQGFSYEVVASLPTASASTKGKIYLVPSGDPQTQNIKDEFITIDNGASASPRYTWEQIGSTAVDLDGYVTTADLNTALAGYTTTANLTTLLAGKQDVIQDLTTIRSGAASGATAYQKPGTGIPASDLASGVIPTVPTISTDISSDATSDEKTASPKSVKTYVDTGIAAVESDLSDLADEVEAIDIGEYVVAWDGNSTPVVANIPAGVTVTYNTTTYTGELAASASTIQKIYLVATGTTDNYDRYITVGDSTYSWVNIGTTEITLADYATKTEVSQLEQKVDEFEQSINGNPGYKSGLINSTTGKYSDGSGTRVVTLLPFNASVKITCFNGIKIAGYYQYISGKSPYSESLSSGDFINNTDVVAEVTIPLNTSYPNTYVVFRKTDSSASLTTQEVIDNVTIDLSGTTDSRISKLETDVLTKVDKVAGKGLSSNDYTDRDKNAVDSLFTDTYVDVTASETQDNHYIDYEGVVQSTTTSWKVSKFDVRGSSKVKVSGFNHHTTTASGCYPLMAELGTDGTTVLAVHETGSDQRYTDEEFTLNAATAYILVGDKGTYSPAAKKQVKVLDIYTKTEVDEITGDLDGLQTSDKSNLVAAINEAAQSGGGGGGDVSSCVRKMPIKTIYVGDNLLGSTVGSGTGWTYNNGSYTHTSGNTAPLVFALATTSGKKYIAKISCSSISGFIEESLLVSIGDGKLCDLYNGSANFVVGLVSDGGYLKITPASTYTGTISSVELMEINEGEVGTAMTISLDNVSAGTDFNNITGWYNTAIGGNDALQANINGSRNIAIGVHSLMALKSGERNIGIGTFSLKNMVYGLRNIAIGADSMMYVTGAEDNVAIGKATFDNASGGDNPKQNVAIGSRAMQTNQANAQKNVAIGYDAGRSAQDCNVCVGWRAGYNATSNNVYIGHNAGFHDSGANNVYIGYNTYYGTATRSNNVFIGYDTHPTNQDSVQNSIAIGAGVVINESNTCKIGNSSVATFILGSKKLVFNNDNTVSWEAVS